MNSFIMLNGEKIAITGAVNLEQFMGEQRQTGPVAVALNGQFVPKSQYGETQLQSGDTLEIVAPMQGG